MRILLQVSSAAMPLLGLVDRLQGSKIGLAVDTVVVAPVEDIAAVLVLVFPIIGAAAWPLREDD